MASAAASTHTAIILVTDLVGSTELRARLGEDAAEELRRVHDRLLTDAILHRGGEVVKGLGDGVLARFTGASDAVAAAIDIQQGATRDQFNIRVGISAGDVLLEDGDVFGTPVIEASRLCAHAEGGQILAAQLVQLLGRGRGGHTFTTVGDLDLKGLPDPVTAAQVVWEAATLDEVASATVPLPAPLAAAERFPYAGRAPQCDALRTAWKQAVEGTRQIVLISGEPGMGKTRLAAELARAVHAEGATVLFGQADEHLNAPYRAIADALRHLVTHAPTAVLEAHVAEHGDLLARMVPDLLRRVPEAVAAPAGDDQRAAVFDAAVDMLGGASAEAPVLLFLDDLHWADHPTLLLLRHLAKATAAMAVLVVGTYRDTDLNRSHPLAAILADMRRERGVERVTLRGLDDGEVVDLMAATAGHDLDDRAVELGRAIHGETGGNPFFVGEVLTHLAESGAIYERDGRWVSDHTDVGALGVPEGVREVIGRRLSALDDEAEKALRAAAAIGATFDVEILAAILERDIDDIADVLDEPVQRGLIAEVGGGFGRYRFAHALVRQALYDELTSVRRVRLHQRILAGLDERGRSDPAELAHHACEGAAMGGGERAVELSVAAAEGARQQLAWEEAVVWYRRALDAEDAIDPPDSVRRAQLLLHLGRALTASGQATDALAPLREAAELASAAGDVDILAASAAAFGHAGGVFVDPNVNVGLALVDEALRRITPSDTRTRARLLVQRARWVQLSNPAERDRLAEEGAALARQLADPVLLLEALEVRAGTMSPVREHAAMADEMRAALDDSSPSDHIAAVLSHEIWVAHRRGDLAAAARLTQEEADVGRRRRSRVLQFRAHMSAATLDLHAGRLDASLRHHAAARALVPDDGPGYAVIVGAVDLQRIWLTESSVRYRRRWWRIVEALPELFASLPAGALVAEGDELRRLGRRWLEEQASTTPPVWLPLALAQLASLADGLDADVAAGLHDRLVRFEGEWLAVAPETTLGSVDIHLARCARGAGWLDEAVERYERAIADHERAGEVLWRAHAAADLAETLVRRGAPGDADRAREVAGAALATAEELDLVEVRAKAESVA